MSFYQSEYLKANFPGDSVFFPWLLQILCSKLLPQLDSQRCILICSYEEHDLSPHRKICNCSVFLSNEQVTLILELRSQEFIVGVQLSLSLCQLSSDLQLPNFLIYFSTGSAIRQRKRLPFIKLHKIPTMKKTQAYCLAIYKYVVKI